jgi:hypothetical protein
MVKDGRMENIWENIVRACTQALSAEQFSLIFK